jgi:hypothetical protein
MSKLFDVVVRMGERLITCKAKRMLELYSAASDHSQLAPCTCSSQNFIFSILTDYAKHREITKTRNTTTPRLTDAIAVENPRFSWPLLRRLTLDLSSNKCRRCACIVLVVQVRRRDIRASLADVVTGVADSKSLGSCD